MNHLPRKKLPLGIQTFADIRNDNCYYADKSGYAVDLAEQAKYYFLSRPRRFGKSLFLDTLKELFEGNAKLFEGLQAEKRWDWHTKHPVIFVSFGEGVLKTKEELNQRIRETLEDNQIRLDVECTHESHAGYLSQLIREAHKKYGQRAVVLVDEYDKPILDNITDSATATDMREGLKNIYSVFKGMDAHLRFVFITGVSKFSKVSLFSGLNNLKDITLDKRYSAICGYTDEVVDTVFLPELFDLDREEIRRWYNGYNWLGEGVYNPYDLLLLFDNRQFSNYWFESGTPTFLVKLLSERQQFTPDLEQLVAPEMLLSTFDVDHIPTEALMFQAGYLTIDHVERLPGFTQVSLRYPNHEVRASLNGVLLQQLMQSDTQYGKNASSLHALLRANNFAGLKNLFHAFFSGIPNDWYRKNRISEFEGYYASIFYSHFAALGLDILLEDITNHGRIDMTVLFNQNVYIFEFKVVEANPEGNALMQIKERNYADKYRFRNEPIHLIGVEFSKESRNIVGLEVETI
jgi:hypothetical protein